ncbi:MAG: FAD-dependent 5-carboxymethylaminomethyl-2-thiouridine(34) oxidoreductase MnmC [Massilia sp.]
MDLTPHWRGRKRFVVFDAAFGDGDRYTRTVAQWRADPDRCEHLHYIALCDDPLPGARRVPQTDPRVTLDLLSATIGQALSQLRARIDAAFLDDLAPADTRFVGQLARLLNQGARVAAVRTSATLAIALARAGVGEDGVFTTRRPRPPAAAPPERRAIVLGAGLAGSAACERLCARGWNVTLVERHPQPAMEASGNLAGIFMPLLALDDNISARLTRAAYRYALAYWERLGGIGAAIDGQTCGVLQLARSADHSAQQRRIAASHRYPPSFAQWLEADAAGALASVAAPHGAWLFAKGGWARPASVCAAMLAACGDRLERRFGVGSVSFAREDGQWCVRDAGGALIARAPTLVLASGSGAAAQTGLPLASVRGQVTHVPAGELPPVSLVLCADGYLTPASQGVCSVGASYDDDDDPCLRGASQLANLERLRTLIPHADLRDRLSLAGRVGFRSVAPDRLPLVGALPAAAAPVGTERLRDLPRQSGLFGLLGYASRGLIWAPLAAELLASQLEGEPLPLEAALVDALDPARFLRRTLSRGSPA